MRARGGNYEENNVFYNLWWGANGQPFAWNTFPFTGVSRCLVNRLPGHREICTKTRLAINLRTYATTHMHVNGDKNKRKTADVTDTTTTTGRDDDDDDDDDGLFFPLTFVVHAGKRTPELDAFKRAAVANKKRSKSSGEGVWIVKPGAMNRGRGIEVFGSVAAVEKHLSSQEYGSLWIIQKYIEAPVLVHGRKFDIRQFAMINPRGEVFMYRDSYVRTCSAEYDINNLNVKAIHLTNDAVQKKLNTYGEHEDANKLDFDEFQRALDEDHEAGKQRKVDFHGAVWPAMVEAVRHVFTATLAGMNPPGPGHKEHCFELFGLDFMLDEKGRPVLIEINTSPALFRHGRCLTEMMPRMMEECVQKCVDVVFPPPPHPSENAAAVGRDTTTDSLDRWMRVEVEPVKFTPADVSGGGGGGGTQGQGSRAAALGRSSPFQPGGAGGGGGGGGKPNLSRRP